MIPGTSKSRRCKPSCILWLCVIMYALLLMWSHTKTTKLYSRKNEQGASFAVPEKETPKTATLALNMPLEHQTRKNHSSTFTGSKSTIVMQVRGEMGNHLQKIAHGYGIHWLAQDKLDFETDLRLRHLKKPKWKTARNDIYQCFHNLRSLDYEGGHRPDFVKIQKQQNSWLNSLGSNESSCMYRVRDETLQNIPTGLQAMKSLFQVPSKPHKEYPIVVLGGPMRNALLDEYYERYRELFAWDDAACCAQLPAPDEAVFVSET